MQQIDLLYKKPEINDISVSFRNRKLFSNMNYLFVSKFVGNEPPYIVVYNSSVDSIYSISKKLLISSKVADYLTKQQIIDAVRLYKQMQVPQLGIDLDNNLYIRIDEGRPTYVKVFNKGNVIGKLKKNIYNNWYELE